MTSNAVLAKLLRAIASGTQAKENQHDTIFIEAANALDGGASPVISDDIINHASVIDNILARVPRHANYEIEYNTLLIMREICAAVIECRK